MKIYKLEKIGQLLYTNCALQGKETISYLRLLVDTGSSYTILPWEQLAASGTDLSRTMGHTRIVTASGTVIAPKVKIEWFSCCGILFKPFYVFVHTLPAELARVGILGMDFLRKAHAKIDVHNPKIHVQS